MMKMIKEVIEKVIREAYSANCYLQIGMNRMEGMVVTAMDRQNNPNHLNVPC